MKVFNNTKVDYNKKEIKMKLNKIIITAPTAHFGVPLTSKIRRTYQCPPPSTVIGLLTNIFGEVPDEFILGYTFSYQSEFSDTVKKYKHNNKKRTMHITKMVTDACVQECLSDTVLTVYTSINQPINMIRTITMGQANNLAKIELPIKEVTLDNRKGVGYNQFTPLNVGLGDIMPMITVYTEFDTRLNSYNTRTKPLRFNQQFEYDKNHDIENNQNVFLWEVRNGDIYEI